MSVYQLLEGSSFMWKKIQFIIMLIYKYEPESEGYI